jgi:hypothetical protein
VLLIILLRILLVILISLIRLILFHSAPPASHLVPHNYSAQKAMLKVPRARLMRIRKQGRNEEQSHEQSHEQNGEQSEDAMTSDAQGATSEVEENKETGEE